MYLRLNIGCPWVVIVVLFESLFLPIWGLKLFIYLIPIFLRSCMLLHADGVQDERHCWHKPSHVLVFECWPLRGGHGRSALTELLDVWWVLAVFTPSIRHWRWWVLYNLFLCISFRLCFFLSFLDESRTEHVTHTRTDTHTLWHAHTLSLSHTHPHTHTRVNWHDEV